MSRKLIDEIRAEVKNCNDLAYRFARIDCDKLLLFCDIAAAGMGALDLQEVRAGRYCTPKELLDDDIFEGAGALKARLLEMDATDLQETMARVSMSPGYMKLLDALGGSKDDRIDYHKPATETAGIGCSAVVKGVPGEHTA